ncbi:MAG: GAF domain-containing protein [Verrucomicrobia bacterium]|nr:GAF domain-containing protein [Verrucomicrobiota bacterium]MBI3867553.1 GAF domain-containing protein [Verrucomicrobiota bacterium]
MTGSKGDRLVNAVPRAEGAPNALLGESARASESVLHDSGRLAALGRTGLLDSPTTHAFDRHARLASQLLSAPIALISLLDDRRQYFKGMAGLPEPLASRREMTGAYPFCRHVVETGAPLIVSDARRHPLLVNERAQTELRIASYAGLALRAADGQTLGAFCAIDTQPRVWKPGEIGLLSELAASVLTEISLLAALYQQQRMLEERAALEAQLCQKQRLELLGILAGGVAHDFNNLLGTILGSAELARQSIAPIHCAGESIEEITKAGRRARSLVGQILSFARGEPESPRRVVSLQPLVEESVRLFRVALPSSVELIVSCGGDAPSVSVDATQIAQVIINLLTNAWHALENRPGRISITLDGAQQGDRNASEHGLGLGLGAGVGARIIIQDNGRGMDAATLRRIYEPFFTTKPLGVGTGLGLAIVRGIVEAHGGRVHAVSKPGEGTTFTVYFPASVDPL